MPPTPAAPPMTAEQALVLTEFARACRTAARSVSLYPPTHPSIQSSLSRVTTAAVRLMLGTEVTLAVIRNTLVIDGRWPTRPDQAIHELAKLMHDRLIGTLRVERDADGHDWHALLLLLAQAPEDLIAAGGIAKAWDASGRSHFEIREIDYAELLREREGMSTEWDQAITLCLRGDARHLDEAALVPLLETLGDAGRFGELIERLQTMAEHGEPTVSTRVAALIELVTRMLDVSAGRSGEEGREDLLQTVAESTSRLTPDMLIGLIEQARAAEGDRADVASEVVERIEDPTVASFVARSVEREHGATERLAVALQLLVPEFDRKERLLHLAKEEASAGPLGQAQGFDELWAAAAKMLASYSDETFVSQDYARELSTAHTQAMEVERVSDDPPARVEAWLATVDDAALVEHDLGLLLDLLRIETDVDAWRGVATIVVAEVERRTQHGDIARAQRLAFALVSEAGPEGRAALTSAAQSTIDTLAEGPLARHLSAALRTAADSDAEACDRLCRAIGPPIIGPLAEALMAEENSRAIRRLREILILFGAAGRETVERLKRSPKATVRRTAIEMLRLFGGQEALADLSALLEDQDPQVQRDALRAIVQIGSTDAMPHLQNTLMTDVASRGTIIKHLSGLREARTVPLLCYILEHSTPRGHVVDTHIQVMEALGALGPHPESIKTLRDILYRGDWWSPTRTAALRRAAALALWRIGSPEAVSIIEEAARTGGRGVRSAAKIPAGAALRREKEPR